MRCCQIYASVLWCRQSLWLFECAPFFIPEFVFWETRRHTFPFVLFQLHIEFIAVKSIFDHTYYTQMNLTWQIHCVVVFVHNSVSYFTHSVAFISIQSGKSLHTQSHMSWVMLTSCLLSQIQFIVMILRHFVCPNWLDKEKLSTINCFNCLKNGTE